MHGDVMEFSGQCVIIRNIRVTDNSGDIPKTFCSLQIPNLNFLEAVNFQAIRSRRETDWNWNKTEF